MLNALLLISKAAVLVFYAWVPVSFLVSPSSDYNCLLSAIAGFLLLAHLGEYLWVRKRLVALPGSLSGHLINTLLFGFLYWLPLLRAKTSK